MCMCRHQWHLINRSAEMIVGTAVVVFSIFTATLACVSREQKWDLFICVLSEPDIMSGTGQCSINALNQSLKWLVKGFCWKGFWQAKPNTFTFRVIATWGWGVVICVSCFPGHPIDASLSFFWELLWFTLVSFYEVHREHTHPLILPAPSTTLTDSISMSHPSGLSDWPRDEHMTQSEPLRYYEIFAGYSSPWLGPMHSLLAFAVSTHTGWTTNCPCAWKRHALGLCLSTLSGCYGPLSPCVPQGLQVRVLMEPRSCQGS